MEKKLKIAFFNFTQTTVERGAEVFVSELSKRFKKNHVVTIFSDSNKLIPRVPFLWRFYIDFQGIQILLFTIDHIKEVIREKYDVVIPLNGGWQVVLLKVVTWFYGGKMIISGQSGKGWDGRNNVLIFPDCFVSLSTSLKAWAKKINPFIKVEYIPNGVDLTRFHPDGSKINIRLEKPIILCVGALTTEKRIDLVIKAVSELEKGSLLVVGDGSLKDQLTDLGKNVLGKKFLLTKSKFKDLPKYYREADLFTLPSPSYRSFEIVIVEAMASNLPVVVNDDPIRKEIVGDAGLFVDPKDEGKYVKVLEEALKKKWGDKPRKQAEKFSWDEIARKYEKLFVELIDSRRRKYSIT